MCWCNLSSRELNSSLLMHLSAVERVKGAVVCVRGIENERDRVVNVEEVG